MKSNYKIASTFFSCFSKNESRQNLTFSVRKVGVAFPVVTSLVFKFLAKRCLIGVLCYQIVSAQGHATSRF